MTEKENPKDQSVTGQEKEKKQTKSKSGKTSGSKKSSGKTAKKPDSSAKLKELQKELEDQKVKYLRLSADFDNYRRRTLKEKMEMHKLAGEEIFVKILPVLDDLERAMKSIEEAHDLNAVKEGMELISNKFKDYLKQQGVKEIDSLNKEFDTDVHEAITQIPVQEKKLKGKVVDVIEKGYFLDEKVIRYSKVVIGA